MCPLVKLNLGVAIRRTRCVRRLFFCAAGRHTRFLHTHRFPRLRLRLRPPGPGTVGNFPGKAAAGSLTLKLPSLTTHSLAGRRRCTDRRMRPRRCDGVEKQHAGEHLVTTPTPKKKIHLGQQSLSFPFFFLSRFSSSIYPSLLLPPGLAGPTHPFCLTLLGPSNGKGASPANVASYPSPGGSQAMQPRRTARHSRPRDEPVPV